MLSDYFVMTLDELVKDIDVQEVREKNVTDELIASMFNDTEKVKNSFHKFLKILCLIGLVVIAIVIISFIAHLLLPNAEWLWRIKTTPASF